jgi:methyltransferase-like protein
LNPNWQQMMDLKSVPAHSPNVVTRKTGNEYVLVPVADNIADMNSVYTLNETGAFIWEMIDGNRNIDEIINALTEEYDIDRETASLDVISIMDEMSNYLIINK